MLGWGGVSAPAGSQTAPSKSKVGSAATPREFVPVKSVFVDDPTIGKDPFFPTSVRRVPKIASPTSAPADPQSLPLTVKVILVGQNRKLAQINNRSFEPGEQAEVLVGSQKVKVRCLEIREKSVLLTIEGANQPKEVFIRPR